MLLSVPHACSRQALRGIWYATTEV